MTRTTRRAALGLVALAVQVAVGGGVAAQEAAAPVAGSDRAARPVSGGPFPWPHGARAAVSLAYDDAAASQLDNAIPALNRHGLKATFYLELASPTIAQRMEEWRAAARAGHELGNHSLFHQCSGSQPDRAWLQPRRDLDTTLAGQMQEQVLLANTLLQALDGEHERTYTVPCGDHVARGGDYLPLVRASFVAIKAGPGSGVIDDMRTLDPYAVPVLAPVGLTGAQLIAIVERAAQRGTMVNFTFHGIGGDHLITSNEAHEELLRYLAAHRGEYWTDTFRSIMKYVKANQNNPTQYKEME